MACSRRAQNRRASNHQHPQPDHRNRTLHLAGHDVFFTGGGGVPFPVQNILPVNFNMSVKNWIVATFLGIIPATFVTVALGSGIENIIDQNAELNFLSVFLSPEIYLPIIGFVVILIIAFVIKKYYFKQ